MEFFKIPAGFGMALSMNPTAWNAYSAMTEAEKQAIVDKARNVQSEREMHRIVEDLAKSRMQ